MHPEVSRSDAHTATIQIATSLAAVVVLAPVAVGQGGEDETTATPIPSLPFADTGTTLGFADDSDEACPYTGSTAPDVYYAYTPSRDEFINVSLCQSGYDTKTYVYDSALTLVTRTDGTTACNDDACTSSGGGAFRSLLECAPLAAGETHYVVIDGWSGDAGAYALTVTVVDPIDCERGPCQVPCPPGSTIEGEVCDFGNPEPDDTFNGGCNSSDDVNAYTDIACGEELCGQAYFDGVFRDTDWFRLNADEFTYGVTFEMTGRAEFRSVYGRVCQYGDPFVIDCTVLCGFVEFAVVEACDPVSVVTKMLEPSTYYFFVASTFDEVIDCNDPDGMPGADYTLAIQCVAPPPPCPWDLDGDNVVGFADLLKVLSFWGPCPS